MTELEWLTNERPHVQAPDEETTAHARAALLAHAADPIGAGARVARRPRKAPLYTLAAAVFAIAIVVVAGALPSGDGNGSARRVVGAPPVAEAAPLVKLARQIQHAPAPAGDATLVLRSHHFPDARKDFTGADLYLDDGRYFYGMTLAELEAGARRGDDLGEGVPKQERDAAKAAVDLPAVEARRRMLDATWPGQEPPTPSELTAAERAIIKRKGAANTTKPASPLSIDNNRIWMASMDSLIAGAGDARVRAGVMRLLATIPQVRVQDHGATIDLRNTDFPDGYVETLTVDARTGVIEKLVGGYAGKTPDVTVSYEIKRVTARDIVG